MYKNIHIHCRPFGEKWNKSTKQEIKIIHNPTYFLYLTNPHVV